MHVCVPACVWVGGWVGAPVCARVRPCAENKWFIWSGRRTNLRWSMTEGSRSGLFLLTVSLRTFSIICQVFFLPLRLLKAHIPPPSLPPRTHWSTYGPSPHVHAYKEMVAFFYPCLRTVLVLDFQMM